MKRMLGASRGGVSSAGGGLCRKRRSGDRDEEALRLGCWSEGKSCRRGRISYGGLRYKVSDADGMVVCMEAV